MSQMSKLDLITLYRNIIRHAKVFPSKNRFRILKEIRAEWKENKAMKDTYQLSLSYQKATKGLSQLQMYTNLKRGPQSPDWVVDLGKPHFNMC